MNGFEWVDICGNGDNSYWKYNLYVKYSDENVLCQELVLLNWCYVFQFVGVYNCVVKGQ